jgi:hypothetical protein
MVLANGCGKKGGGEGAQKPLELTPEKAADLLGAREVQPEIAVLPGADLVVDVDIAGLVQAPMYATLAGMADQTGVPGQPAQAQELSELMDKIEQATGLSAQDMERLVLSVSLEGVDFAGEQVDMDNVGLMAALSLSKTLNFDTLKSGMETLAAEGTDPMKIDVTEYRGARMLGISDSDETGAEGDSSQPVYVTVFGQDRLVLSGNEASMEATIDRILDGESAEMPPTLKSLRDGVDPAHVRLAFSLPPSMRQKLNETADQQAGTMNGQMLNTFRTLESLSWFALLSDALDLELRMGMGSDQAAQTASAQLNSVVVGMAKMTLGIMAAGKPFPMLESLKAATAPGGMATMRVQLTEQDFTVLKGIAEQQATGGGMMPGAMPQ